MGAVDGIIETINGSDRLDAATRDVVLAFVRAAAPLIETMQAEAVGELSRWLAGGGAAGSVDHLQASEVVALLSETQQEMALCVETRQREAAAARAAIAQLGNLILGLLARVLVSSL